ncbi:hypothetical protein K7X08_022643 [Anisodus acutangulus]|uniref:PPIase cyclophilin-type domain-containing protein n=1 Tax=Anisodus acutangulus TaxID=402998 RepID=A0A9Q1MID9_9SOLA|nr:hypothetical protein K7X08_022643 [Anisodus acutangulus]
MCTGQSGSSYNGTLVQKFFPGQFFMAGKQGRKDKGEVRAPLELIKNNVSIESKAFVLEHSRSGVVSLALSENDDDDVVKMSSNYHNVEFLITTGPGPCPQLDSKNIVFGTVLEVRYCCGRCIIVCYRQGSSSALFYLVNRLVEKKVWIL